VSPRHSLISALLRASSSFDKQVQPPPVNSREDPIARHKRRFHIDRLQTRVELHQGPVPLVAGPSSRVTFWEDPLARYDESRLILDRMPNGVELCRDFKIPSLDHRTPQASGHARDNHTGAPPRKRAIIMLRTITTTTGMHTTPSARLATFTSSTIPRTNLRFRW
jgi:hypothetical protein